MFWGIIDVQMNLRPLITKYDQLMTKISAKYIQKG